MQAFFYTVWWWMYHCAAWYFKNNGSTWFSVLKNRSMTESEGTQTECIISYIFFGKGTHVPNFFRLIVVMTDQTCLPNSGKTHMYIIFNQRWFGWVSPIPKQCHFCRSLPWHELQSPPVNLSLRAPVTIAHEGYVGWCSDLFISRYAQTTPMNNEAIWDQPLLSQ